MPDDELTRAIVQAISGYWSGKGAERKPPVVHKNDMASDVAAALAPLIEARVREARAYMVEVAESVVWHHMGDDYYADGMEHAKEQIVAALKHEAEEARRG